MLRLSVTVLAVLSLATLHANQAGAPSPADLDRIVTRVLEANSTYVQTFRNLAAEETKDIQQFDKSGRVNKQRRIVSDLLVYQPTRIATTPMTYAVEYRDVREVDGKPVKKRSERAQDVITRAMRAESLKRELEVIDRENQRYDFNFRSTTRRSIRVAWGQSSEPTISSTGWVGSRWTDTTSSCSTTDRKHRSPSKISFRVSAQPRSLAGGGSGPMPPPSNFDGIAST